MSASGDFGPAPPGVDLSEDQNGQMIGGVVTLMVLGLLSVALRMYARLKTKMGFAVDDYLIFAGLFFAFGTGIVVLISLNHGNGRHIQVLTHGHFEIIWKLLFSHVCIYAAAVTCTKSSIIIFYRRIFNLHLSMYIMMSLIIGYFVSVIITIFVACHPLPYFWLQYTNPTAVDGTCINTPKFFLGNGIGAVIIDFLILLVPVPIIWKLQMPRSQRIAVTGILLLGGFVCIAGIVRLVVLNNNTHSDDATWTIAPVFLWSCVEPFIGIVCACLPTLSPLFRRWWSTLMTQKLSSSGKKSGGTSATYAKMPRSRRTHTSALDSYDGEEVELTGARCQQTPGTSHPPDLEATGGQSSPRIMVKDEIILSWN
ncbi:hypothetical protein N7492_007926 [Penicillium capsulatum]|uniref:Rhodopsin domain-containing protein n=1 Tax=Penicillium capsulatum TaxID=69766 RepID=A0A9W9I254_9EURO|nr:hypothetical protein N7492_007926 [Penicillium capsulatum]KAJ6117755.1 hypothetical protein N7512_007480 [Penicillium capsulatum]